MKGVTTLLRAFASVSGRDPGAHLIVVSKPTPGGPTDKLMGELGLAGRARFTHGMSNDELAELLASAQIAVVPSLYEGFSLPAVEHMASGTPLVASRTGALPEVTGEAASLVEPGNPEELADVLTRLLAHPAERERLGDAALRRVQERFAWPAVARATVAQYHATIAAAAASAAAAKGAGPC